MASDVFLSARVLGAASLNSALGRTRFAKVAIIYTLNILSARASFSAVATHTWAVCRNNKFFPTTINNLVVPPSSLSLIRGSLRLWAQASDAIGAGTVPA